MYEKRVLQKCKLKLNKPSIQKAVCQNKDTGVLFKIKKDHTTFLK